MLIIQSVVKHYAYGIKIAFCHNMERRAFERVKRALPVSFFYDHVPFKGTIENLSENGLLVCTNSIFYNKKTIDLLLPFIPGTEKCTAVVKRIFITDKNRCCAGVELINPPKGYIEFLNGIKSSFCIRNHPPL